MAHPDRDEKNRGRDARRSDVTVSISGSLPANALAFRPNDAAELEPGTVLGAYVIRSAIGSGGGGSVYLADEPETGRTCAIKVLHPELARSAVGLARFLREVSVVGMIRHPAIVEIHHVGELPDGRPYFAMEWLEGTDLKQLIRDRGRFSIDQVLEILAPICSALRAAHAVGVVHRDVKASNVHVALRDGRSVVKLLDFGVAKLLTPDNEKEGLTRAGSSIGTPATMAPEQIRGEPVDERTDVYAVGVLVYHMLTGRLPFRAPSRQETEVRILDSVPPPPSHAVPVSPAVDAVVMRCLDKDPARRYASIAAIEDALRAAAAVRASSPPDGAAPQRAIAIAVAIPSGTLDEGDDRLFDDAAGVLDLAERALREAGFTSVFQTATSAVGARVLGDDFEDVGGLLKAARAEAGALSRRIASRSARHPSLRVEIRVHETDAVVYDAGGGQEIDGPIIDVASWPAGTLIEEMPASR
jgi:serine/threonine-protein kinase